MLRIPDLVSLSKLDTCFNHEFTKHSKVSTANTSAQRRVRTVEVWKKEHKLGRGSFGQVWLEKALDDKSKTQFRAVKILQKHQNLNYLRELEAIALFSYPKFEPCFVKSHGWYEDPHNIFIAMEFLPNGDLQKYLSSPLSEDEGRRITLQLTEGLNFMHENGFAHRDLKPANILVKHLGPLWWVKIADFGITKRAAEGSGALRTRAGTPAFAPPEVLGLVESEATHLDSYTFSVDIWSLGVILMQIFTAHILFRDQEHLIQYARGLVKFPSDSLAEQNISLNGRGFVESLLSVKPDKRPRARELLTHDWINSGSALWFPGKSDNSALTLSPTTPKSSDFRPTAQWSTQTSKSLPEKQRRPESGQTGNMASKYYDCDLSKRMNVLDTIFWFENSGDNRARRRMGVIEYVQEHYLQEAYNSQETRDTNAEESESDDDSIARHSQVLDDVPYRQQTYDDKETGVQNVAETSDGRHPGDREEVHNSSRRLCETEFQHDMRDASGQTFETAMTALHESRGRESKRTVSALQWLGKAQFGQKNYCEAEITLTRAIEMQQSLWYQNNKVAADSAYWLGKAQCRQKKYKEAEQSFQSAIETRRMSSKQDDKYISNYVYWLGRAQYWQGRFGEAEKNFQTVALVQEKAFDLDDSTNSSRLYRYDRSTNERKVKKRKRTAQTEMNTAFAQSSSPTTDDTKPSGL